MAAQVQVELDVRTQLPENLSIDEEFIHRVLCAAARTVDRAGEVSVSLVDNEEIRILNRQYRDVDSATDVLSFAMEEGEQFAMAPGELPVLGDIVISVPRAIEQADAYGHSPVREFSFLLVHGFLHLIGYDHQDETAEREMFGLQESILEALNITRNSPSSP